MNLEETLRDALQRDAAEVVFVGPGPDDARRRAFRRRRRMQAGVVAVSAVALAGASLAVVETRSSGPGARVLSQPPSSQATADLAWRSVDGTVGFDRGHFTTADGVTYALSTAPGSTQPDRSVQPQELYATKDGVDWTHTSLGSSPWVADLTASNGVLYAVGTGPGSQGDIAYKVSTSSDGGAHWDDTALPVSFTAPSATVRLTPVTTVKLARGPHTTVVIATAIYTPDFSSVIGNRPVVATDQGVQLIDPQSCKLARPTGNVSSCTNTVTETKPWSDFGISDPSLLHQQQALVRDDGGQWQTVSLPSESGTWVQAVGATSNGFLIAESVPTSPDGPTSERLLSSTDGRTWTALGGVPAVDSVSIWGDRVIGLDSSSSTVYTSNDAGQSWSAGTAVSSIVGGGSATAPVALMSDVGPLGYAVVAQVSSPVSPNTTTGDTVAPDAPNGHTYLLYSADGSSWKTTDLTSAGAPAHGSFASASVGNDHIEVTFQDPVYGSGTTPDSWKLTTLVGTPKA